MTTARRRCINQALDDYDYLQNLHATTLAHNPSQTSYLRGIFKAQKVIIVYLFKQIDEFVFLHPMPTHQVLNDIIQQERRLP